MQNLREFYRGRGAVRRAVGTVVSVVSTIGAVVGFVAKASGQPLAAQLAYGLLAAGGLSLAICSAIGLEWFGRSAATVPAAGADDKQRARVLVDVLERYMYGLVGINDTFAHAALPGRSVNDLNRRAHDLSEAARDCIRTDGQMLGPARLLRYDAPHPEVSLIFRDGWSKKQAKVNEFAAARRFHLENFIDELRAHIRE